MAYYSTKTYGHNIGLSAVFRQPHADHSHCRFLHGYSLGFKFIFAASSLDNKNWAVDFGGLKPLKQWLEDTFDHKVVLDENDEKLHYFHTLERRGSARAPSPPRRATRSRWGCSPRTPRRSQRSWRGLSSSAVAVTS